MLITGLYGYHGGPEMNELRERVMNIVNHYRTPNNEIVNDRYKEYHKRTYEHGTKNLNVNRIKVFKEIPEGIEILIDYVDTTAIRATQIPTEIVYESIYRKLPELFEE